jgi:hypothetical protein
MAVTETETPHSGAVAELKRIEASATYIGWMITIISGIAGVISIIVVIGVVYLGLNGKPIPPELTNWGGIILGFYFGQFVTLVKDYMGIIKSPKE